jgi:hypothetical protein
MWLKPEETVDGIVVREAVVAKGREFIEDAQLHDPMMAYIAPRGRRSEPSALELDEDRQLWRDSMALLSTVQDEWRRPKTVDHLAQLIPEPLTKGTVLDLDIFGMALQGQQKRNIGFWRHERQPLPLHYLHDDELVNSLRQCLELAEEVHKSLYGATRELAEEILTAGVRDADDGAVSDMLKSLGAFAYYWSSLELPFRELVVDLAAEETDRFEREGQVLRQLDHPNIVKMLATVEEEGLHYIIMEYVSGGSLRDLLDAQPHLPIDRVMEMKAYPLGGR